MSQEPKAKRPTRYITPKGIAVYPWLDKPDTKFQTEGVYKVGIRLPPEQANALLEKLEAVRDAAYVELAAEARAAAAEKAKTSKAKAAAAKMEIIKADLPVEEEEDGSMVFRFKMKASGIRKGRVNSAGLREEDVPWVQQPDLFGADGSPLEDEEREIWGGSTIKVAYHLSPYYNATNKTAGIALKLDAVMVLKAAKGSGRTAEAYGFEAEDEDEDAPAPASKPTAKAPSGEEEGPPWEGGEDDVDF